MLPRAWISTSAKVKRIHFLHPNALQRSSAEAPQSWHTRTVRAMLHMVEHTGLPESPASVPVQCGEQRSVVAGAGGGGYDAAVTCVRGEKGGQEVGGHDVAMKACQADRPFLSGSRKLQAFSLKCEGPHTWQ